jgi:hypothetical protein
VLPAADVLHLFTNELAGRRRRLLALSEIALCFLRGALRWHIGNLLPPPSPARGEVSVTRATGEIPIGPRIWIVNEAHWPRAYLRAELIERGYDAVGFETLGDVVLMLALARAPRPTLLILDLHGQQLDDSRRAALLREGIPILAVVGAARSEDDLPQPPVTVLRRPLTIGAIADAAERIAGRPTSTPVSRR